MKNKLVLACLMLPTHTKVLDLNGNLLWGHAPQPKFGEEYKTRDVYENLMDVENGAVYVDVAERGTYTLETVPLVSLFNGIWG